MGIILKKLSPDDGREIYEMLQKIPKSENGFMNAMHGASYQEYLQWLKRCDLDSKQTGIADGWKVPWSAYWLFADGRAVGYGKIRHFLTEKLLADGGHIGYSICPSERRRGLGKLFLGELIRECGNIGINRALLTINKDNTPSIKMALANGGVIEKSSDTTHYIWIDCMQPALGHKCFWADLNPGNWQEDLPSQNQNRDRRFLCEMEYKNLIYAL